MAPTLAASPKIAQKMETLERKIDFLAKLLYEALGEDVKPSYQKKLAQWSRELDKGQGIRFENEHAVKKYVRSFRA